MEALDMARTLFDKGILVNLALFPAVPRGKSVVRMTPSILHTDDDMAALASALQQV